MITYLEHQRPTLAYRMLSAFIAFAFIFSVIAPPTPVYAQLFPQGLANLPLPGTMVPISPGFTPAMVTGITIHPENPLEFDFIIGSGDDRLEGAAFEQESTRLIKYFLAALTVPEEEMWVNLSPYEEDRIIPNGFGDTEMGRDLLAQDYILKQLTASLMYPENELGEQFWTKVRAKAYEKFGTTEIPMNTFNKIWIIPEEAVVYEHGESAFVVKSHLKVMMEEDYVALQKNIGAEKYGLDSIVEDDAEVISGISSEVVREVLIPEIEKEVNQGETFANLRQIYNSVILAAWYKQNLKDSLLGQVYVGKNKTAGVDTEDKQANQKIYDQYVAAFKKGVYNYIKEDYDPATQEIIPRKYFSGGADLTRLTINDLLKTLRSKNFEELDEADRQVIAHFSDSGLGTYATNVNLVEIAEGKTAEEVSEIAKPAKTSSPITEKKSKKKTFKISGRDKLDAYQFIVNFYQDSPQITIKLKEILKSMGTLMSSSDPVTFSVDLASGNKLTRYDIVSIVKDVIDSYSSDPKYLRVLDNPSGRRTYMEETMGPLIRHILLTATTGSSPITGKEPETRVSGKDKHNVYGYDVSFRQDDSEVTIKLAKTSEPSSDSTTFTIKRATGNTLTPSDVASILENIIKVYSFAPGYLIAQEHVEELRYMTTKIAKILKMVTTVASQEHADYMPSTDKFGLYNFDVNFHPSDCEITIKLTKTSEMKISGFLPTGETFIVKRAPDNKLTSSDIASIVAKIIEAYSSDPDYLSKGFHLRGQRRYMEQKIVSILEMVTTVSSSITDAAVQNDFITMDDIGLYGKRVLIRPDINAPVKDGRIGLTERIIAASETIGETADRNAKVVVIAHQGRAGDADYVPLEQHAKLISKQIGRNVRYVNDLHGQEAQDAIRSLKNGDVLILHNVRPGENDPNFVADLEPLFDYFILDGFSVSHRDQPSVTGFKNIPNIAGRLMERELSGNLKFVSAITHPYVELLGGSKISDHINPLRYGLEEGLIDTVLTGGMLGQLLLLIEGYNLGEMTMKALRSQDVDAKKRPEGLLSLLPALEEIYRQYQDRFEIPVDLAYEDENGNRQEIMVKDLPKEGFAYLVGDNGTQTAQAYAEILKGAKTAFVKGPQGNYKNDNFRKSSKIALAGLSESDAFWMTGGGDTDAMVVQMGLTPSHRTLAGGAFLRFKTGQILVGVQQLKSSHERYDIEDAYKRVDSAEQSPSSPVTAETLIIETDTLIQEIESQTGPRRLFERVHNQLKLIKEQLVYYVEVEDSDLVQSYAKELEGIKIVSGILNDPRNLTKKARGAIETGAISPKDINTLFHEFRGFVREKKSEVHEYGMSYAIGDIEGNLAPVDNALTKIMEDLTLIEIARKVVIDGASFLPEASLITSGILNDPRNLTNKARGAIETDTIRPSDLNKLFREFRDFVEEKKREVLEYRMRHARGGVKGNLAEVNDAFNKITNDFARIESARQKTQNITASVIVKGILNDKRNLANKARGAIETSAISRDDLYNLFHELQGFVSEKKGVVTEYERSHEPGDDSSNLVLVNKALKKITEDFDLISQLWQTSEATETSSPVIKETTGTKRHPHVDHVQLYDDAATIRPWFNPDWTEEEAEEMIYMNLSTGKVFPNKQAAERHFNELVKDGKQVWGFYVLVDSGDWTGMKKNVLFFGEREEKSSSPIEDGDTFKTSVAEFAKEIVAAPLNSKERANIENGTISSDDLDKIHDRLLKISRKLLRVPITDIMYDEYRDGIDEVPTSLTGAYKEIAENLYFVGKARQKMQDTAASPVVASYLYADLPTGLPTEVKKAHESAVERGEPVIVNIIGSWDIGFPTNFSDAEIVDEILEEINKLENANQYQYKFTRNYPGNEVIIKRIASSPIIDEGDKPLGGINLNSALLDLQIKRDGNGVPLPMNLQPIHNMRIDGFVPVIINVTPVLNLPLLLGFADSEKPFDSADADSGTSTFDLGFVDKYRNKYTRGYEYRNDLLV